MKTYEQQTTGRVIIVRLDAGDDLLGSIEQAIAEHGIKDGYVASGIGTLDYCVMHMVMTTGYPPVEHFAKWENEPLEVSSIDGIIADGTPHLHMVVSNDKIAVSGHLEPGCRILYLGEVVIRETTGKALRRVRNDSNINELVEA